MDLCPITPRYAVAPQIAPEDLPAIAAAGFATVICNRPDSEVPAELRAEAIRAAAQAAGMRFEVLELDHQTLTPENALRQRHLVAQSEGPVLAYCRSGTRCAVIWGMGQLRQMSVDQVMAQALAAGYRIDAYRPLLEQAAIDPV